MVRILKTAKASYAQKGLLTPNPKARLHDQVREVLRFHHYSLRTEKAYWQWIRRYLVFCRDHPHLTSASALQAPNIEPSVANPPSPGYGGQGFAGRAFNPQLRLRFSFAIRRLIPAIRFLSFHKEPHVVERWVNL
jgi:hypothetical protein